MKREAISRDDFATCTQSYFLYGIHYGSRLVCRHTAKVLPRVTRSRYTSVGKETLCRVSFLEHTAKKKCTRQPLDGSLQLCRVPGEMHTAKRGDAHIKVWIFAVCCGSYTQQKMDQGQLNWLLCRVPWSLHTAKWQYFVCVFYSVTYMVPQSIQAVQIYHNNHRIQFINHNKHHRQFI